MNDTSWTGNETLDIDYLIKLEKAIRKLIKLEEERDDDDLELHDARTDVKRRIKGIAVDFNIHNEFINSCSTLINRH
jgi:hypothetical protein